jgi:WD40 repeat protein
MVALWGLKPRRLHTPPFKLQANVDQLVFSPDGRLLLTLACIDDRLGNYVSVQPAVLDLVQSARLWDARTGEPIGTPLVHRSRVEVAEFHPEGAFVLTGGLDGVAQRWSTRDGSPVGDPIRHQGAVMAVGWSPDGKIFATGGEDRVVWLWSSATGEALSESLRQRSPVSTLAFNQDGTTLAVGCVDGTTQLWDVATARPLCGPLMLNSRIIRIAFRPDGRSILVAGHVRARVWTLPEPIQGSPESIVREIRGDTCLDFDARNALFELSTDRWRSLSRERNETDR